MTSMKIVISILVALIGLAALTLAVRNAIVRAAAARRAERITGYRVEAGGVSVGLLRPAFELRDVRLLNPPGFSDPVAMVARRIQVAYAPFSLMRNQVRLREMTIDIPEIHVVQEADGRTNLELLQTARREKATVPAEEPADGAADPELNAAPRQVIIERLSVKIGAVDFKRYDQPGGAPRKLEFKLDVEKTYANVTDLAAVSRDIGAQALANALPQALQELGRYVDEHREDLEQAAENLRDAIKGLFRGAAPADQGD